MPNTPALVGAGVTAIAPGSAAGADDLDWAEEILSGVGAVVRVKESALDAVTGLSGSGPAYVFLVAEAMADAGVLAGLPRDLAETLAFETLYGASKLLREADSGPADLQRRGHVARRHHRCRPARTRAPRRSRGVPGRGHGRHRALARTRRVGPVNPASPRSDHPDPRRPDEGSVIGL